MADGGLEAIGLGDGPKSRKPAVASAHDGDAIFIGDTLLNQVFDAPSDVVLHELAPLQVTSVKEILSVSTACPKVRLQNRITSICQELNQRIVAPVVAWPLGTTVNQYDNG